MSPEALLPLLLVGQGVVGGVDTLLNHEILERLPHRLSARREIGLHSIREAIYASLFGGLAWFEWHGIAAFVIAFLLAAELLDTAADELVENRTRVLPQNERALHVLLTINLGLIIAAAALILPHWSQLPTQLTRVDHDIVSWILSALALSSAAWSVRDLVAWRRLAHGQA